LHRSLLIYAVLLLTSQQLPRTHTHTYSYTYTQTQTQIHRHKHRHRYRQTPIQTQTQTDTDTDNHNHPHPHADSLSLTHTHTPTRTHTRQAFQLAHVPFCGASAPARSALSLFPSFFSLFSPVHPPLFLRVTGVYRSTVLFNFFHSPSHYLVPSLTHTGTTYA